jgi:oligoribonuclease NrnB/cAMP/cGMP phosphodiesterase (DHH superfamily)
MASAWTFWKHFGDEAEYIPVSHGQPVPLIETNSQLFILDFSYKREVCEALRENTKHIRILDHHKTAEQELAGLPYATFDMNHSGAALAWKYLHFGRRDEEMPLLIRYIEDRDLWRFLLPHSREVNSFIQSFPMDLQSYEEAHNLLQSDLSACTKQGIAIDRYKNTMVDKMCKEYQMLDVGGYSVPVVNASMLFSEVGHRLCELFSGSPFAGYYFDRGDGLTQWGLRSIGDFDVSQVARQAGGGGHKNAAGFQVVNEQVVSARGIGDGGDGEL